MWTCFTGSNGGIMKMSIHREMIRPIIGTCVVQILVQASGLTLIRLVCFNMGCNWYSNQ